MVILIKQKCRYYRKYQQDIWGICYNSDKGNYPLYKKIWIIRFMYKLYKKRKNWWKKKIYRFVYRLDERSVYIKRRKYNKRWLSIRITRIYYLTIKDHQFRELFKKALKLDGNLDENYCHLLEGRLLYIFYRTNFMTDIISLMDFIREKNIYLDNILINFCERIVRVGEFITFRKKLKNKITKILTKRVLIRAISFNKPRFMFISYYFWFAYLLRKPKLKELVFPIAVDISRIRGYY